MGPYAAFQLQPQACRGSVALEIICVTGTEDSSSRAAQL